MDSVQLASDDIVITGMSGRFPESSTIEEFADQLFTGVDMVTADSRRWKPGIYGLPERNGKLKNLSYFDEVFFGVHSKQAHFMDPQIRLLLESTYEAIIDAGFNPAELHGSRTGVYVAVCTSDSEEELTRDVQKTDGYGLLGCYRSMFANRVSYAFDLKGPSLAVDAACSSSLYALEQAVNAIKDGRCDAAIIAGTNLCLKPNISLCFNALGMLSAEGRCASFDASGSGYVRSEAVVALLIQRRGVARRVYATIRGAGVNTDGKKTDGITFPSVEMQRRLAEETFRRAGLRVQDVSYIEAHGTGTQAGDPQEANAIAELFCKHRETPLLVGAVKSNMGHAEAASGLCSIVKVLLAMERGEIPGNLHYKNPNPKISALSDGRIKIVDRNTVWNGGVVAINSFGFGGTNAHVILESESHERLPSTRYAQPRLVVASGRTKESVQRMLSLAAEHTDDSELHSLMDAVQAQDIAGHNFRGYKLLVEPTMEEILDIDRSGPLPVWFVFSGMGPQLPGVARSLMQLPAFARTVLRASAVLSPFGVDLEYILMDATNKALDIIINAFVAYAVIQIALVDLLRAMDIHPDGIIGHSLGEVGAAYADDTLTLEQAVLVAYWRGRSVMEAAVPSGAMAAIGLTWEQCAERCPPDLALACHNAFDNVTVSGPVESVDKFVEQLEADGVFARRINIANYAFHSKYVADAAPLLLSNLQTVIAHPKPRSPRWISTSLARAKLDLGLESVADAEYFANNLVSPVWFWQGLQAVPKRALVLELAPQALLQSVLKRTLSECIHVPLLQRNGLDQCQNLLTAIGRTYVCGKQPKIGCLYPRPQWPVSRGTPGLASHVVWDHSTEWKVVDHSKMGYSAENVIEIDLTRPEYAFLEGHNVDGRLLFPAAGYLVLVWKVLAKSLMKNLEDTCVAFDNVQLHRATIISREEPVRFHISILEGLGCFVVSECDDVVVSGRVRVAGRLERDQPASAPTNNDTDPVTLIADDLYKELQLCGLKFSGQFRSLISSNSDCTKGTTAWNNNWITYIDSMLQFVRLNKLEREYMLPTGFQQVHIDPVTHLAAVKSMACVNNTGIAVHIRREVSAVISGGIEIRGVKSALMSRSIKKHDIPKLENYMFVPYEAPSRPLQDVDTSSRTALAILIQTILENSTTIQLSALEAVLECSSKDLLLPFLLEILKSEPQGRIDATIASSSLQNNHSTIAENYYIKVIKEDPHVRPSKDKYHLVLASNVLSLSDSKVLNNLSLAMLSTGFLLLKEKPGIVDGANMRNILQLSRLQIISHQHAVDSEYLLLRPFVNLPTKTVWINLQEIEEDQPHQWLVPLQATIRRAENEDLRVYLIASSPTSGVLGLAKCIRMEPGGAALRVYFLPRYDTNFDPESPVFTRQIQKDLTINLLSDGVWGTYRHVLLPELEQQNAQKMMEHGYVNTTKQGDLSSLRWIESPLRFVDEKSLPPNIELCRVAYGSLNFRDVMLASGKLSRDALPASMARQDCVLGVEFSGWSSSGTRVMGMVPARGLATTVLANRGLLWDVPSSWTLQEAATVPIVYSTAYFALVMCGRLARGETLLVHAGSGGVGLAAIAIALHAGCTVLTTVSTAEKRRVLLQRFPDLQEENIGYSRDNSFEKLVHRRTDGRGVDLVLNSLAGEQLETSLRCLTVGGRFLEIGRFDIANNTPLGMAVFLKDITFQAVTMYGLFEDDCDSKRAAVVRCVSEGIKNGVVRPLPSTVFSNTQLEEAFRYMATGRHVGKVLIHVCEQDDREIPSRLVSGIPRLHMHPARSYIVIGGLGGIGLELANWLVGRGATVLVLNSHRGIRTGYQSHCIHRWRKEGVLVKINNMDLTTPEGGRLLLREAMELAPVAGVFNLAAVLRDAFLENLTVEDFRVAARSKIDVTKSLDSATRELTPELEYFVMFSSMSSGRGNVGQSSYAYSNSSMENIVRVRREDGLPGHAIQWGVVGEVGLVVAAMKNKEEINGMAAQSILSCMDAMETLLAQPYPVTSSMVLANKQRAAPVPPNPLVEIVANVLGFKKNDKISQTATLLELGIDSLMGAEIKQILERSYDIVMSAQEIRALTFSRLEELQGLRKDSKERSSTEKFYGHIGMASNSLKEIVPVQVLVKLPGSHTKHLDTGSVFMVHSIEGVAEPLSTVASNVRGNVFGLQCTREAPLEDMSSLARFYVSQVRAVQPEGPYVLVGYSFGASVVFEMALQLQEMGSETRLVLIDGSPEYVAMIANSVLNKHKDRTLTSAEVDALVYFVRMYSTLDPIKLSNELKGLRDWESRAEHVAKILEGVTSYTRDTLITAVTSFYHKLLVAEVYEPSGKLRASVTLYTATDSYLKIDEDYGLRNLCSGSLRIQQLTSDHRTIVVGDAAATIADHVSELLNGSA